MIRIEFDLSEFRPAMVRSINAVPDALRDIVRALGFRVERYAKLQLYPGHGKVTGRLRSSIRPEFEGEMKVTIEPHTAYAESIEQRYGYMRHSAQRTQNESDMVVKQIMQQYFG